MADRARRRGAEAGVPVKGSKGKDCGDFREHFDWMVDRARKLVGDADAEDVANEALFDAQDENRPKPPPEKRLNWLYTLVWHRARALWKRRQKSAHVVLWKKADDANVMVDPSNAAEIIEMRECIFITLDELPPDTREMVVLNGVEEVSAKELSIELGMKQNTVESRLRRARPMLVARLGELLDRTKGSLCVFFSFGWLRRQSFEHPAPGQERAWFGATIASVIGASWPKLKMSARFVANAALAVFVGVVPLGLCAADVERVEVAPDHGDNRRVATVNVARETTGTSAPAPGALEHSTVLMPVATAPIVRTGPLDGKRQQSKPAPPKWSADEDSLLDHARVAFVKAWYTQCLAYLDEGDRKFPQGTLVEKRRHLRALTERRMAEKR